MVNKSPRELIEIPAAWSIPEIMAALTNALESSGPALSFGPSKFRTVEPGIAVVIPTSGSTGEPKEVALTAEALRASAFAAHQYLRAKPGQTWSLLLPTNHIAGVNVLVRALALGTEIVDSNYDFTSIVPTQLFRALHSDLELQSSLKNAKAVLVGGAATDLELLEQARSAGINAITTYGMSEMCGGCIYNNEPLQGVEIQIQGVGQYGQNGRHGQHGQHGQIALRGPMSAREYLGDNSPLTDSENWFLTNDTGFIKDEKLYVTGRIDDQIISGGEKVSLGAIDSYLNGEFHLEFMCCALPHPEWGQALCLAASTSFDITRIKSALRARFGNQAVPKLFLENVELPRTPLGKPDRRNLAQRFEMMSL